MGEATERKEHEAARRNQEVVVREFKLGHYRRSPSLTNRAKEGILNGDISTAMESARHSTLNVSRATLVGVVVVVLVRVGAP
jgi:hypothetical protein